MGGENRPETDVGRITRRGTDVRIMDCPVGGKTVAETRDIWIHGKLMDRRKVDRWGEDIPGKKQTTGINPPETGRHHNLGATSWTAYR